MKVSEETLRAAVFGLVEAAGSAGDPVRAFWLRVRAGWGEGCANAAAFVPPGRSTAWANEDPEFALAFEKLARDEEARGLDAVRRAAARGDRAAMALVFRAARGFARPFELPRKAAPGPGYPMHVARAMVNAAYAAWDRGPDPDDPEPEPRR